MQALQDLVAQCLQQDPKARPSACKILKHKFFKVRRNDNAASHCCQIRIRTSSSLRRSLSTHSCSAEVRQERSIASATCRETKAKPLCMFTHAGEQL